MSNNPRDLSHAATLYQPLHGRRSTLIFFTLFSFHFDFSVGSKSVGVCRYELEKNLGTEKKSETTGLRMNL